MSFSARIAAMSGVLSPDATILGDILTAEAARHIFYIPEEILDFYAAEQEVTGSGLLLTNKRLLYAHKAGRIARLLKGGNYAAFSDVDSIHLATELSPAAYLNDGKLYVLPGGGYASVVSGSAVAATDTEISFLPDGLKEAVLLSAAIRFTVIRMAGVTVPTIDLSGITAPITPAAPSFTLPSAAASSVVATTIGALPDAPAFSAPTAPAAPTISAVSFTEVDIDSGTPDLTLPEAPTIADLTVSASAPSSPSLSSTSIGALPSAPTFSAPTMNAAFDTALSDAETRLDDDDIEMAGGYLEKSVRYLNEYRADIDSAIAAFNAENADFQAEAKRLIDQGQITSLEERQKIEKYAQDVALYSQQVSQQVSEYQSNIRKTIDLFSQSITAKLREYELRTASKRAVLEGDVQAEAQKLAKYGQELSQYTQEIQSAIAAFNASNSDFQAESQRLIEQARLTIQEAVTNANNTTNVDLQNEAQKLAKDVAEYEAVIKKFNADVQLYVSKVNEKVSEYQSKVAGYSAETQSLNGLFAQLSAQYNTIMAQYIKQSEIDAQVDFQNRLRRMINDA